MSGKDGPIKQGPPPFNKPTADVVLRSSDKVDFHVRQAILAEASPFFETMFTLPQLPENRKRKERDGGEYKDGVIIVEMAENAMVLDSILRFCYPVSDPKMKTLVDVCDVLDAAHKFDMEHAITLATRQFAVYAEVDPVRAYALAGLRHWEGEMKLAARLSLRLELPWDVYLPEMEKLSAGTWFRLYQYHHACCKAASALADLTHRGPDGYNLGWLQSTNYPWFTCQCAMWNITEGGTRQYRSPLLILTGQKIRVSSSQWWRSYMNDAMRQLKTRPHRFTIINASITQKHINAAAASCSECQALLPQELERFNLQFMNAITKAIQTIELKTKP